MTAAFAFAAIQLIPEGAFVTGAGGGDRIVHIIWAAIYAIPPLTLEDSLCKKRSRYCSFRRLYFKAHIAIAGGEFDRYR